MIHCGVMADGPVRIELFAGLPKVGRRELLQILLGTAGATLGVPVLAADHPIRRHAADASAIEQADRKASATNWKRT